MALPSSALTEGVLNHTCPMQPLDKGKAIMTVETGDTGSQGAAVPGEVPSKSPSQLRADAPEFIPSSVKKSKTSQRKSKKKRTL
uniref:Uncharacterized protein n=1 Tax=Oryza brachyantha TaxID=4533 RepID=J3NEH3_ORYBR